MTTMNTLKTVKPVARGILAACAAIVLGAGSAGAQTAGVQVIHNSPDPAAAVVDVYVGPDLALDDFAFREATPVIDLPAGVEITLGIAPGSSTGAGDAIATFPVTLTAGETYVVMATGVLGGSLPGNPEGIDTAFTLEVFAPLTTSAAAGEVGLLAYHGAPDAPTVDVVAVDVGVLVDDLAYRAYSGTISVPAADYVLQVTPGDDNGTVVASFEAPLSGLGGGTAVVFASGFLTGAGLPEFGLFAALTDGTVLELGSPSVSTRTTSWTEVRNAYR